MRSPRPGFWLTAAEHLGDARWLEWRGHLTPPGIFHVEKAQTVFRDSVVWALVVARKRLFKLKWVFHLREILLEFFPADRALGHRQVMRDRIAQPQYLVFSATTEMSTKYSSGRPEKRYPRLLYQ